MLNPGGKPGGGKSDAGVDHVAYWPIRHGPTLSLYYKDPDGNRREFQVEGEAFSSNPIGVTFDPDELVEQFRKGVPERQLLARPEAAPAPIPREHGLGG